jgi:hypothetical protein
VHKTAGRAPGVQTLPWWQGETKTKEIKQRNNIFSLLREAIDFA